MSESSGRPRAVTVVGYGTLAIGAFTLCISLLGPLLPAAQQPEHPFAQAAAGWAMAILMIGTGRALLRLKKWASLVIEIFAGLLLLFVVMFGTAVVWTTIPFIRLGAPYGMRQLAIGMAITLIYAVPLSLTVLNLRRVRLRGLLG